MYKDGTNGTELHSVNTSGTSITFTPEKHILYKSIPSSVSGKAVYHLIYNTNKTHTTIGDYTYKVIGNEKPTFPNFDYEDINPKTIALTDNPKILINGYSNLKVKISTENKAYSNYGAQMDKYRLNVGSMTSVDAPYKSDATVEMTINNINSPSITVTAIDKREYSTPVQKTATFKAYFKPVIKAMSAIRGDGGVGSQVTLVFNGDWWNNNFGKVQNTIKNIEYYYKKTTESSWTKGNMVIIPTISGNEFSGNIEIEGPVTDENGNKGFDVSNAYNIKLVIIDELDKSNEYQTTLGTGAPALAICNNKVAIGQKYDEEQGGDLQVKGVIKSNTKQLLTRIDFDLTHLSTSNFYPIVFKTTADLIDCEIHSVGGTAAHPYNHNHNHIRFQIIGQGWADIHKNFTILQYGAFDPKEITIGCVGEGTKNGHNCVWLRGGIVYRMYCNYIPTLYADGFSSSDGEYYSAGTNYYGGTNTNVDIWFTPQSTITSGTYFGNDVRGNTMKATKFIGQLEGHAASASKDGNGDVIASTFQRLDGSKNLLRLTDPGGGANTGYRIIMQQTMAVWQNSRIVLAVTSRHHGSGILCIGLSLRGEISSYQASVRYYGAWCQVDKTLWLPYYNPSTGVFTLIWKHNDYSPTNITVLSNLDFVKPTEGAWFTTLGNYGNAINVELI